MSKSTLTPAMLERQYAAALNWAIDSADTPYKPGALARQYHSVAKPLRESLIQEVNRIFRERTGVTRPIDDSAADQRLKRQWLRIRDVVMARRFDLFGKETKVAHRWAVYRVDMNQRVLEIDVEDSQREAPVIQPHVTRLVFGSGTVPPGFQLAMKSYPGFDRWSISWTASVNLTRSLTWQFVNVVLFPKSFDHEWRAKSRRDRAARQRELQRQMRVLRSPNKQLGGRTPLEVMRLQPGNYEVQGQGFMTVWKDYIYFQKLSSHKDTNEAIRWFLRRGIALPMALSLNSRQQSGLFKEAAVASFLALRGGLKFQPYGGPVASTVSHNAAQAGADRMLNELQGHVTKTRRGQKSDLVSVVREAVKTTPEREAQSTIDRLARQKHANKLTLLRPLR